MVVVLDVLVLAAPDLALYLVLLLVVWEEYQGKRPACPLLQRPRRSCSVREANQRQSKAFKRPSRGN